MWFLGHRSPSVASSSSPRAPKLSDDATATLLSRTLTASRAAGASVAIAVLLAAGCTPGSSTPTPSAEDEAPIAMQVRWPLTEPQELPAEVQTVLFKATFPELDGDAGSPSAARSVARLSDAGGPPTLEIGRLPFETPIHITVRGDAGEAGGDARFFGDVSNIVLSRGASRRFVELQMYAVTGATMVSLDIGRVFQTATALSDDRILVAGGFRVGSTTACPPGTPGEVACFAMTTERSDAFVFDVATGRAHSVTDGLLAGRGGHTATLLPDGRVLLAGGAATGTLMVRRDQTAPIAWVPGTDAASQTAAASFEIFDPQRNYEIEDDGRDGDPGRGGFVGRADAPTSLGTLDTARVGHGATLVDGGRVLLAGGANSASTFTVFDPNRAGGYGVIGQGTLGQARTAPALATSGTGAALRARIIGGRSSNAATELVELWSPSATVPVGTVAPLTIGNSAAADWNHLSPRAMSFGADATLVMGWYGARCTSGAGTFDTSATLCGPRPASFVIDGSGATSAAGLPPREGAALVRLSDGSVVAIGGVGDSPATSSSVVQLVAGRAGEAPQSTALTSLRTARFGHAAAAFSYDRVFVVGGWVPGQTTSGQLASVEILATNRTGELVGERFPEFPR